VDTGKPDTLHIEMRSTGGVELNPRNGPRGRPRRAEQANGQALGLNLTSTVRANCAGHTSELLLAGGLHVCFAAAEEATLFDRRGNGGRHHLLPRWIFLFDAAQNVARKDVQDRLVKTVEAFDASALKQVRVERVDARAGNLQIIDRGQLTAR